MYKKIVGNSNFKISLNGSIVSSDGSECEPIIVDGKVEIEFYNKPMVLDVEWLSLISHFEIELPYKQRGRIFEIGFTDIDSSLVKSISGKHPIIDKPIDIGDGFRLILPCSRYAVNKKGDVKDLSTNELLKSYDSNGYRQVCLRLPDKGRHDDVFVHRLVAMAWVPNDSFSDKPIVNHKNGKKSDNRVANLEWVSYSENIQHAVGSGMRKDNVECKIRDYRDGKITIFPSITTACQYIGYNNFHLDKILRVCRKGGLIANYYELKRLDDGSPWTHEGRTTPIRPGRFKITVNDGRAKQSVFYDLLEFSEFIEIDKFRSAKDLVEKARIKYPKFEIELIDTNISTRIDAFSPSEDRVLKAMSVRQISKLTGVSEDTVRKSLNRFSSELYKGWAFRATSNLPWPEGFTDKRFGKKRISAKSIYTGVETVFDSLREASKETGLARKTICDYLGKTVKGWTFKEIG